MIRLKNILTESSSDFLSKVLPIALDHKKQFQIPASITLAQAWLESGRGESGLTVKYHNWFGITCGGYKNCVELKNKATGRLIKWRSYDTDEESFNDHARLLTTRYKKYVTSDDPSNDYVAWAKALTLGGYAGANYGSSLIDIIRDRGFDEYDQFSSNDSSSTDSSSSCPNCDCWTAKGKSSFWNGKNKINGKTVPEITISKSKTFFHITYKGAPSGFLLRHGNCGTGDTIHQLCNVFVAELNPYLKTNNLKPDIQNIKMTKKEKYFGIRVPLSSANDGYYVINRRGGMGHGGNFSDLKQYEKQPNYEEIIKTAGNITEKFITYSVGYNKNTLHIQQNKKIRNVIGSLYYVLVDSPEKYFAAFRSYNPFTGGDDEKKAASWFRAWFNKKFKSQLEEIKKNTSQQNKESIAAIYLFVDSIINDILAGNSRSYPLIYFIYNVKLNKYQIKTVNFKWDYL